MKSQRFTALKVTNQIKQSHLFISPSGSIYDISAFYPLFVTLPLSLLWLVICFICFTILSLSVQWSFCWWYLRNVHNSLNHLRTINKGRPTFLFQSSESCLASFSTRAYVWAITQWMNSHFADDTSISLNFPFHLHFIHIARVKLSSDVPLSFCCATHTLSHTLLQTHCYTHIVTHGVLSCVLSNWTIKLHPSQPCFTVTIIFPKYFNRKYKKEFWQFGVEQYKHFIVRFDSYLFWRHCVHQEGCAHFFIGIDSCKR